MLGFRNRVLDIHGLHRLSSPPNPDLEPVGYFIDPRMVFDDLENEPLELAANVTPTSLETISASIEKQVHNQERGALVPVCESVISCQRFRERSSFPLDRAVVTRERPTYR